MIPWILIGIGTACVIAGAWRSQAANPRGDALGICLGAVFLCTGVAML